MGFELFTSNHAGVVSPFTMAMNIELGIALVAATKSILTKATIEMKRTMNGIIITVALNGRLRLCLYSNLQY